MPYINHRLLRLIRADGRDFNDEELYVKSVHHFYAVGRKMRSNKRYDFIVDICNPFMNSRHIIGIRFPKGSCMRTFHEKVVVECIQDPVLLENVDLTKIFTSVDRFEGHHGNKKSFNLNKLREYIVEGIEGVKIYNFPIKSLESIIDRKMVKLFADDLPQT